MRIIIEDRVLNKSALETVAREQWSPSPSGKRRRFTILTEGHGELISNTSSLYDRLEVGQVYRMLYQDHTHRLIGLESDEIDSEDRNYPIEQKPKNSAELALFNKLIAEGWGITRRGFPDMACSKDGRFMLVEVKPKRSHKLKSKQREMMEILSSYGVECYKWTPEGGFETISPRRNSV